MLHCVTDLQTKTERSRGLFYFGARFRSLVAVSFNFDSHRSSSAESHQTHKPLNPAFKGLVCKICLDLSFLYW